MAARPGSPSPMLYREATLEVAFVQRRYWKAEACLPLQLVEGA